MKFYVYVASSTHGSRNSSEKRNLLNYGINWQRLITDFGTPYPRASDYVQSQGKFRINLRLFQVSEEKFAKESIKNFVSSFRKTFNKKKFVAKPEASYLQTVTAAEM